MKEIVFADTLNISKEFQPQPAYKHLPEWYKNKESYINNEKKPSEDNQTSGTIKRCMPVFDSITQGYLIFTYCDIWVSQKVEQTEDGSIVKSPWYQWPAYNPVEFHPVIQADTHPNSNGHPYPKFVSPWSIKTPPGYSTMFFAPVHRDNVFTVLPGVVDTDKYNFPVNFPMVLSDPNFEGLIPAGTPIVQLVPFKRDNWKISFDNIKGPEMAQRILNGIHIRFFDSYKNYFRQKKEYR